MKRKFYLPLLLISFLGLNALAQTGEIRGRVVEKGTKDGVPFASVAAFLNGSQVQAAVTDMDGYYVIKPLTPGTYDIKATCIGYTLSTLTGVVVTADKFSKGDIELPKGVTLPEAHVYAVPLIDPGTTATQKTATYEEIQAAPVRDVNSIASQSAGVFQRDEGDALNIRGSRSDATAYYVDGMKVRGRIGVSNKGTEQITVITGGVPAQYGDATGGIVAITTRGPSKEYAGGIEASTSKLFDDYNNNIISFDLSGPIFTDRDSVGRKSGQPLAGFFVAGDYYYDGDPNPSAIGAWKVRDDKLAEIQKNPLVKSENGAGFDQQAQFLTYKDLEHVNARMNATSKGERINGKIDFRPFKNVTLTFGGSYDRADSRGVIGIYSLMNYENNSQTIVDTWRVFGKITQRFSTSEKETKSASVIKNAYYSIQADYSRNTSVTQNDKHKDRIFDYGYVGRFVSHKSPFYVPGTDTVYDSNGQHIFTVDSLLLLYFDSQVDFTASDLNPNTANYTSQLIAGSSSGSFFSIFDIRNEGGLINDDNRVNLNVYGLWASTGRIQNFYGLGDATQYRVTASGSADIKNHNIIVGMEYEQRIDRSYALSPSSLWSLMRDLEQANTQNGRQLDTSAILTINTNGDTTRVDYNVLYIPTTNLDGQVAPGFHENIHNKFGVPMNGFVDIDAYDPSTYSLDLFTPDQLAPLTAYYGYDYKGNILHSNPSLNDYFFKKDDNLNFTREIGAFQPNYVAGYIQDKFTFNDLIFNIGIRVDRFDANQKALKDKYLLWPAHTAGSLGSTPLKDAIIPSNIGDDYVVYVNDFQNPTSIKGFRKDDKWYDAQGTQITDLSILKNSAGCTIQPYLFHPSDATGEKKKMDINAFKDYEPQTTIMPRIAFSFPISDEAYFAAHYDILTQRPDAGLLRFNPGSYLSMANGLAGNLSNPDLKPEKTTDYEITFSQKLSKSSALSISAFYKELRDMLQIINVTFAYPVDYSTYGNIDFGTVKGLTFSYDLRRTGNVRMNASYTLQFADGTGSNPFTNAGVLANAGQNNLRETKPLDFDQRHTIVTSVDFHYGSGKDYNGPIWFKKQVFSNAGLNFVLRAGSGTPYTRQSNITPTADFTSAANGRSVIQGSINGSRLPWQFRIDAKVDKNFEIKMGKKKDGESRRPLFMNVYLQILNLLDARNIQFVYRSTGNPEDDGYLTSPDGIAAVNSQISPQSYIDLYQIAVNNPGNYSLPRRIRLGMQLNF